MKRFALALALLFFGASLAPTDASVPKRIIQPTAVFRVGMLRVERFGNADGTPLIFIPALFCGSWQWNGPIAMLSATHDIYAVTLPGFDGRPRIAPRDLMNRATADISTLIRQRHLTHVIVIGHSLGGTLAVLFGEQYPGDANGIIAVEGGFPIAATASAREASAAKSVAPFIDVKPAGFDRALRNNLQYVITDKNDVDTVARLAERGDPNAVVDWSRAALLLDSTPQLHAMRANFTEIVPFDAYIDSYGGYPTLAAKRAAYDRFVGRASGKSNVMMISPSRHFVMFDQPALFDQTLAAAIANMER